ncbi:phosphatidylinositol 3-kinase catalytic subunit type 3-like isoform X2 [Gordionus sp. m RMFG-2023]|uniref:phosphatidylinositol 3-kinase catalytic subunit type 3-like isoform X2 n=1 Tax=Gordionus sp. m RMFG-2023 TaxID=3053472 RepID=UPI0031FD7471
MERDNLKNFSYVYSCDLDINLQIKIGTIEGNLTKSYFKKTFSSKILDSIYIYDENVSELFVTAQVFLKEKPLSLISQTSYKNFNNRWSWNEIVFLPIYYSQLPIDAQIIFNIWDCNGAFKDISIGEARVDIFEINGLLQQGVLDLKLNENEVNISKSSQLTDIKKQYRDKDFPKVEWLDRLTFREIEILNEQERKMCDSIFLVVEFPPFSCDNQHISVVYYDKGYDIAYQIKNPKFVIIPDPQISKENLSEFKHHALTRGSNSISSDLDLKPSTVVRDKLLNIVNYPPFAILNSEEQDLVWKYRYHLKQNNKALSKLLQSVKWNNPYESKQALQLMNEWQPVDVENALELLTPRFRMKAVRKYAVSRLAKSKDEDLSSYLLQLVQALRYENLNDIKSGLMPISDSNIGPMADADTSQENKPSDANEDKSVNSNNNDETYKRDKETSSKTSLLKTQDLATFLIDRASRNSTLANYFYWYLHVECEEQTSLHNQNSLNVTFQATAIASTPIQTMISTDAIKSPARNFRRRSSELVEEKSISNNELDSKENSEGSGDFKVNEEVEDIRHNNTERVAEIYVTVMKRFYQKLVGLGDRGLLRRSILSRQQYFVDKLCTVVNCVTKENTNRKKKQERLIALLCEENDSKRAINFSNFDPLPLPLDPEITVRAIIPQETFIFKSALMPCKYTFKTVDSKEYKLIFKHGDDLRQDQLILQIIKLMDKLLQQENLDLKLTAYKVLATSTKHGLVQFIESCSIAEILSNEGSIQNYFRRFAPSDKDPYGIKNNVMETYIKSCAGYCVITYILGIGDRHFDNLLITKTGKLFHIDFGYILGRDPKPMPPPMKLSKEMVEAMGGTTSKHYQNFKKLCYTAFLHLRRHANLIMNLFSLMLDANIPDICLERERTVKKDSLKKSRYGIARKDWNRNKVV